MTEGLSGYDLDEFLTGNGASRRRGGGVDVWKAALLKSMRKKSGWGFAHPLEMSEFMVETTEGDRAESCETPPSEIVKKGGDICSDIWFNLN